MAVWKLSAATPQGDLVTQLVEAQTRDEAAQAARARGLAPIDIVPKSKRSGTRGTLSKRDLASFIADLAALLGSHVPLPQALQTISRANSRKPVRAAADSVAAALRSGSTLSAAFRDLLNAPPHVAASILAGERGSELGRAMDDLSTMLGRQQAAAQALTGAMIYPAILLIVTVISLAVILVGVVPGIEPLITGAGASAPPSARMLVATSHAVQEHGALAAAVFAAMGLVGLRALRLPAIRFAVQKVLFRASLVGRLLRAAETASAFRTVAGLTASGMSLPDALSLSAGAARTGPVARALEHIAARIREGADFLELFETSSHLDRAASGLVAIGIRSGRLSEMLNAAATAMEREVDSSTKRIIAVLPAVMTLVLGGLVGGLSVIVLGAIMSVNDVAL